VPELTVSTGTVGPLLRTVGAEQNFAGLAGFEKREGLLEILDRQMFFEQRIKVKTAVFQKFGHLNRWALVELAHSLPEWKDPDGSAFPIKVSEILAAQKKSPDEIRAIESELQALSQVDYHLAAR